MWGPSLAVELIAIPNGLAGCKRKIEFDRCRWQRRGGRKDERGERLVAQVWCGSWAYWDTYPIRRWKGKRENVEEGRSCHRKEGRKGREGTIWRDGKSNQRGKNPRTIPDRVRLRAFGDNYRRADSIPIGYHAPRASQALSIKASFQSLSKISSGVVASVATIKKKNPL